MVSQPFLRYALLAGTGVGAAAGMVGYLLVLRAQVFTADALSHVAVAGALAALAFGVDPRLGLFAGTVCVAVGMGLAGSHGKPDDVAIGSLFGWILGLGTLFLTLYTASGSTRNGAASVAVLFGSVLGLSRSQAITAAAVGVATVLGVAAMARPLLFATLDEAVARARGVPVTSLGLAFLALAGVTAAEATQVVGALLLLGLVAAPAGAAQRLTCRPFAALWLSTGLAVASVWIGLAVSYAAPVLPPSFAIVATAAAIYAVATLWSRLVSRPGRAAPPRARPAPHPAGRDPAPAPQGWSGPPAPSAQDR